MGFFSKTTYIIIRIVVLVAAAFLAYWLVSTIISKLFQKTCLIDTEGCLFMDIYKYKDSFIAQIYPSSLWVWYNGQTIYIFGQAPGQCGDPVNYEPVFSVTPDFTGNSPVYNFNPDECIMKLDQIIDYYVSQLKVNKERIYFQTDDPVNNVLDVVTILYKKKIIR